MSGNRRVGECCLVIVLMFLGACTSTSRDQVVEVEDRRTGEKGLLGGDAKVAHSLVVRGEYGKAAEIFRRLANETEDPVFVQEYRLHAADNYARNKQDRLARHQMKKLNRLVMSEDMKLLSRIVQAQLSINEGRPQDAFSILPLKAGDSPVSRQIRLGLVRSDAWLGMKRYSDAVLERIDIDSLITDADSRVLNHQWIWNQLQSMPRQQIFSPPIGMTVEDAGWWALAAIVKKGDYKQAGDNSELTIWRETYPNHPAAEDILFLIEGGPAAAAADLQQTEKFRGTPIAGKPQQVALLLPLSGHYADAGRSVLSGFRRAANDSVYDYIDFKVYDSADINHSIKAIAQQAIADGAQMIVGPLQKNSLSTLVSSGNIGVPILALNTLPIGQLSVEGLYQFALSPENDAAEVAYRALGDGHNRTAVLVSQDRTGERMANAFIDAFEQGGGRIISYLSFPPRSNNLSKTVKQLLRADSNQPLWQDDRTDAPRDPADQRIDMVFFSATPRDGRLIRPMLRLHKAVDLPVYSTARIYKGSDPTNDRDLDGLVFCDMPSKISGRQDGSQLSAMGADAFLLVNQLNSLVQSADSEIQGKTGRLSVNYDGQVWRHLDCAVFRQGQPIILP